MLTCGHDRPAFGRGLCPHLLARRTQPLEGRDDWFEYFAWYRGKGLEADLLCQACVEAREGGGAVNLEEVCEECYDICLDTSSQEGVRGTVGVAEDRRPFEVLWERRALPSEIGPVVDFVPLDEAGGSVWLLLEESGGIVRLCAGTGVVRRVGHSPLRPDPDAKPWVGHLPRPRLHASAEGAFAAVVIDHGREGELFDLTTGRSTLRLHGGSYRPETVAFSCAFAKVGGRVVLVHRTDWNRVDVSDAATGELLTPRAPQSPGALRPLDYFHGALYVSPLGQRILSDGWVWHPTGIPRAWDLQHWCHRNVWESESGPSLRRVAFRDYYWGKAYCWLDEARVAVGGIGDDDVRIVPGARIFDASAPENPCLELKAFAGPAGQFFADRGLLYSTEPGGLSRWDVGTGCRTGLLEGFAPSQFHRGVREFAALEGRELVRCRLVD